MPLLRALRAHGLRITSDGQRILVSPREALSEAAKTTIRINKAAILRELEAEASERQTAILAARDASGLQKWYAPLVLGRLNVCNNCDAFRFGAKPPGSATAAATIPRQHRFVRFSARDFRSRRSPPHRLTCLILTALLRDPARDPREHRPNQHGA